MHARTMSGWSGLAALVLFAACGGTEAADKAGNETVVLQLATIDEINSNGQSYGPQAFVDALGEVSGGRLKLDVTTGYGEGAADAESELVKAIASGELDGGWPTTRAFANGGITGLEAVEAPMTITSYDAEKALVSGDIAATLLQQLNGSGVIGLGLAVGPLRRPFAAEAPLLGPDDWQGARFRSYNSPVQADAIKALGATPVEIGFGWIDEVAGGNLRGAEFDIAQYAANGYSTAAGNVTANVVLWPKMFVLSMSQKRFDALTDQQQDWVREAAEQAVQASVQATYDETTPARQLCDNGVRFVDASSEQLAALGARLTPVIEALAADPTSGPLLQQIQAVAAQNPGPDVPEVPASCREPAGDSDIPGAIPEDVSALPDGLYRVEITEEDVLASGQSNNDGASGIWTLNVHGGTFELFCRPVTSPPGHDCGNAVSDKPFDAGQVRGTGSTVYFVYDEELASRLNGCVLPVSPEPGHCGPNATFWLTWTLDGDSLRFSDSQPFDNTTFTLEPWRKIS